MFNFVVKNSSKLPKLVTFITILCVLMSPASRAEESVWEYEMQPGDHIWKIAHELLTDWRSWQTVERLNNVDNDRLMAAGTILRIPTSMIQQRPATIQLIEVSGPVTLISADDQSGQPLKDQVLKVGDQIQTGTNASVLLKFEDNTQVLLNPESEFIINQASIIGSKKNVIDIEVLLKAGEAQVRANPEKVPGSRFVIETPSAFATTRGTVYRVRADQSLTATEVTQGKIDVENTLGRTKVPQNFGTLTAKNSPPQKPIRLLAAPAVPAIDTIRYLPARLSWGLIKGATSYRSQLSDQAEFQRILLDNLGQPPKLNIPATLADGQYWLMVRASDTNGLQGLESLQHFSIDARPFPPTIQSPLSNDPVYTGDVSFVWAQPEEAKEYLFELSAKEDFSTLVQPAVTLSSQTISVPIADPGTYFWRVTSINANQKTGPGGYTNTITVRPTPATPELQEATTSKTELGFAWQKDDFSERYQIQLANDKDFTHLVDELNVTSAEATFKKPDTGTYYMRVRGFDSDNYAGSWSGTQKVEVPVDSYLPAFIWSVLTIAIFL
ncbi:FecR domain-containing protein [Neptunomonas sp.]|uniref:FecR domain-containing protein n=1 Tax=Neptunomonas sp. TaxID=1971898 RepID=UPI0035690EA4